MWWPTFKNERAFEPWWPKSVAVNLVSALRSGGSATAQEH
jgi:hypothetical protein